MAVKKKTIENQVVKEMKALGVYKPEYKKVIQIFSGMVHQYLVFEEQFEESEYQITEEYTNKAGATNERKVPLYTAMESLRKDIATYSSLLCINPKSLNKVSIETQGKSVLAEALAKLEDRGAGD